MSAALLRSASFVWTAAVLCGQNVSIVPRVNPAAVASKVDSPRADLSVDVPLVLVPVHVTTPRGNSVTSLGKGNFRLFENGVEQQINQFGNEDAPISIGMLFDSSGSMRNKMKKSMEAVAAFFRTANSEDEFFLVEFNEKPKLAVPFTRNSEDIYKYVSRTKPIGRTSLLDAIHVGLVQMKNARHLRKAMIIFSDGGDNRSRYTESEINSAVRESDIQVYAMGIFDPEDTKRRPVEEQNGPKLLDQLAEETGGKHYPVRNLDDLPDVCARIGNELRNQYLLGYSPSNDAHDGKFHRVEVHLSAPEDMPPLTAHYRQGYYSDVR